MVLNRLISTTQISHEDWLKFRKNGIGGSDAGAICGVNQYKSPMGVYIDKTSMEALKTPDNEAMRIGRDLEQYVADRFCEATGKKVRRENAILGNDKYPFAYANVDRIVVGENAGLECKTASVYSADKWKDGKVPESYEIQCHHYMAITGAEAWYIACVILGQGFVWKRIERDEELIQSLMEIEKDFWENHVLKKQMPEPDGSDAADKLISERFQASDGMSISLVDNLVDKLKRREEIKELQNKLSTEISQIEQEIKLYMEDAESAESDEFKVTWKAIESSRVDAKKLKAEHPEIYQECLKTSNSRRFTIKKVG